MDMGGSGFKRKADFCRTRGRGSSDSKEGPSHRIFRTTKVQWTNRDTPRGWSKSGCIIEGSSIIDGKKFYRICFPRAQKRRLLFKILYCKKETRGSKANFEFETNEQIYKKTKILNGKAQISKESGEERGLALYCGPKRCIYAHPNSGRAQEIPKVLNSRKLLSIEGDSMWNAVSPKRVYKGVGPGDYRGQKTGGTHFSLPGRCPGPKEGPGEFKNQCKYFDLFVEKTWMADKYDKVIYRTVTKPDLRGRPDSQH